MWNELAMLLRAQITLCDQLLSLGERQRQCLIAGDRKEFIAISTQAESVTRKFSDVEGKKQNLFTMIGAKYSGKAFGSVLSLIQMAGQSERDSLKLLLDRLDWMARKLRFLTQRNQELLTRMMEFSAFNVNVMMGVAADGNYAPKTQGTAIVAKKKMFDQTV